MSALNFHKITKKLPEDWNKLLITYDPSIDSVESFCKKNKISSSSFYRWSYKLNLIPSSNIANKNDNFIPVITENKVSSSVKITLSCQTAIEINSGFELSQLKQILQVIKDVK